MGDETVRNREGALARAMVTYLALVLAAAALVAHLIWGQWFYGALVAGWPPPSRRFGDPPPPPNPRDPDRD